jgi:hypothetical protein
MEYVEQFSKHGQDKRIFERIATDFSVKFADLNSSSTGQARLSDISAHGLGMIAGVHFQPATQLELWLQIPVKGMTLYVRGEVVWSSLAGSSGYRTGVRLDRAELMDISRVLRAG